jgi:hypothetical protein
LDANEPYPWHIPIEEALAEKGQAFVIDLKPHSKHVGSSRSLYQLRDVWGYSCNGWTPGMLRLRGVVVDGEPQVENSESFQVELSEDHDSIYTFIHFDGTIRDGRIKGKWTPPGPSSTNSTLLWPAVLDYFFRQIEETSPGVLKTSAV